MDAGQATLIRLGHQIIKRQSNDSELIEDEKGSEETSTTIDQLQKELNELATLLSQQKI